MKSKSKKILCYKKKVLKKQSRRYKKKYDDKICLINKSPKKNKNDFLNFLKEYKLKKFKNHNFFIYPFCSEKIHISKYIDNTNYYHINKNILNLIEKNYKCNFIKDKKYIKEKKHSFVAQKNNPKKFIEYILENLDNKNHFIIAHSNFLTNLTKYIINLKYPNKKNNKFYFDNLDLLQIVIDTSTNEILLSIIRRFDENYQLLNCDKLTDNKLSKTTKSIFIMRHCIACHNITNNIFVKMKSNYSTYSCCFKETVDEMKSVSKHLKKIIKTYGGMNEFNFGSSIIFRAIITILILVNYIN